jgi:hypothetical protein
MAYMCRLFRGAMLGQEVKCLKVLGLTLLDHAVVVVVVPGVVQVMINMTLDLVAVVLAFTPLADHVFLVVIAFPPADHIFLFEVIALLLGLG